MKQKLKKRKSLVGNWQLAIDKYSIIGIGIVFIFPFIALILWRIDSKRNPDTSAEFFPVSVNKFIAMWFFTIGLYGVYWFYRNFLYIKNTERSNSWPIARGIFMCFWYFPLWKSLKQDQSKRVNPPKLPSKLIAILLSVVFFATFLVQNNFWGCPR